MPDAFQLQKVDDLFHNLAVGNFLGTGQPPVKRRADHPRVHVDVATQQNIVQHAHPVEQGKVLEGSRNPHACNLVRGAAGDVFAVQFDPPDSRGVKTCNGIGQGGFPAAVRADQAKNFTLLDA